MQFKWGMDVAPDKQIGQWGILVSASSGKSLCEKENGAAKMLMEILNLIWIVSPMLPYQRMEVGYIQQLPGICQVPVTIGQSRAAKLPIGLILP
jgi:hypothetical protein